MVTEKYFILRQRNTLSPLLHPISQYGKQEVRNSAITFILATTVNNSGPTITKMRIGKYWRMAIHNPFLILISCAIRLIESTICSLVRVNRSDPRSDSTSGLTQHIHVQIFRLVEIVILSLDGRAAEQDSGTVPLSQTGGDPIMGKAPFRYFIADFLSKIPPSQLCPTLRCPRFHFLK